VIGSCQFVSVDNIVNIKGPCKISMENIRQSEAAAALQLDTYQQPFWVWKK